MFGQVIDAGGGRVVRLTHTTRFVRLGGLGVNDFRRREGAACVRSMGGDAFAEGREGSGRGGEGGDAGFGYVEDVESTAGTGFDLRAG